MGRTVLSGDAGLSNDAGLSLAVTSSTAVVGVAIGMAGASDNVTFEQVVTDRRHAEELTPMLAAVLARAGVELSEIDRFVVDVGPGRFTGLRVGLATVRSLALATGRPVVGLTSLEILAGAEIERPLTAVIDARRGEVFQQRFDTDGPAGPAIVTTPEEGAALAATSTIVGDGADRYGDLYGVGVRAARVPSAAIMIAMAGEREALSGPEILPRYLRDPDVNVNVKTRHTPR